MKNLPRSLQHILLAISLAISVLPGAAVAAEEMLPAYNTYTSVPFVVGSGGLASDLVSYLNGKLKGRYQFQLQKISREDLNKTALSNPQFNGAVLFLSPFLSVIRVKPVICGPAPCSKMAML